jgi:hypothetical protein
MHLSLGPPLTFLQFPDELEKALINKIKFTPQAELKLVCGLPGKNTHPSLSAFFRLATKTI